MHVVSVTRAVVAAHAVGKHEQEPGSWANTGFHNGKAPRNIELQHNVNDRTGETYFKADLNTQD